MDTGTIPDRPLVPRNLCIEITERLNYDGNTITPLDPEDVLRGPRHHPRLISVQRGLDPREFALVAFGGAGPLHANAIAATLGIPRIIIPLSPGISSALGLLLADVQHDFVRTQLCK